jgi:cytochrome c oxidase subunit II
MKYIVSVALFCLFTLFSAFAWSDSSPTPPAPKTIQISAKRYEYTPSEIHLKVGQPVVLELTTEDRKHGFKVPELGLVAVIKPGEVTRVPFTPTKTGRFPFHCSVYCGSDHESMTGAIIVE